MKADISDAPERVIRRHHKGGVFYTVICLVIGSIAATGAFLLINRASSIDSLHKQSMSSVGNGGQLIRAGEMAPRQDHGTPQLQASLSAELPPNTARQTVFNDQNFVPKGAHNVVSLRVDSEAPLRKEPSARAKLTIVRQSPTMKERACWPYKQGSIESRNCRNSIGLKYRN